MRIYKDLSALIGRSPLVEIIGLENQTARLIVKIESFNPGGSIKDRTALSMIQDAEARGVLTAASCAFLLPARGDASRDNGDDGGGLVAVGRLCFLSADAERAGGYSTRLKK